MISSTSIESARQFYRSKNLYLKKCYGVKFAYIVKLLDKTRLRIKFVKYNLLALFFSSKRVAQKKSYYDAMRCAIDF